MVWRVRFFTRRPTDTTVSRYQTRRSIIFILYHEESDNACALSRKASENTSKLAIESKHLRPANPIRFIPLQSHWHCPRGGTAAWLFPRAVRQYIQFNAALRVTRDCSRRRSLSSPLRVSSHLLVLMWYKYKTEEAPQWSCVYNQLYTGSSNSTVTTHMTPSVALC